MVTPGTGDREELAVSLSRDNLRDVFRFGGIGDDRSGEGRDVSLVLGSHSAASHLSIMCGQSEDAGAGIEPVPNPNPNSPSVQLTMMCTILRCQTMRSMC